MWPATILILWNARENKYQSDCSDPSQQEETVPWTNRSSQQLSVGNLLKAREKSWEQGAIGLGFASPWLKNWHEIFKEITKRGNRNRVISFDSRLKTALFT